LRALHAVAFMRKQHELNSGYFPTFWLDHANGWLARYQMQRIALPALTAAAIVSGVPYSPLKRWPHDIEWGLQLGGIDPSSAWRDVLRRGKAPAPLSLQRPLLNQTRSDHVVRVEQF
jgi:hypothetical protein